MEFIFKSQEKWSLPVKLFGVEIRVHFSLLVFLILLLIPGIIKPQLIPYDEGWMDILNCICLVVAGFASIFIHEMAHSLMVLCFRNNVEKIMLFPVTGVSILKSTIEPYNDLVVSAVGPVTNLAIARFIYVHLEADGGFFEGLALINMALCLINLVPMYPLDGGMIFHDILLVFGLEDPKAEFISLNTTRVVALGLATYFVWKGDIFFLATIFLVWILAHLELNPHARTAENDSPS